MADKQEKYQSPNDTLGADGTLVPQSPEIVSKRLAALRQRSGDKQPTPTAYKVIGEWTTSELQRNAPHKVGDTLSAAELQVPDGTDREKHLQELISIGLLQPQFDAPAKEQAAPPQAARAALAGIFLPSQQEDAAKE